MRRRGGEGVVRGVVARRVVGRRRSVVTRRVVGRRRSVHGRIRTARLTILVILHTSTYVTD